MSNPIPNDPSGIRIAQEFGSNTRNDIYGSTSTSVYDMKEMYLHVFGNLEHDRKEFGGTGKPEISTSPGDASASTVSETEIDVSFNVSFQGGLTNMVVYIEYHDTASGGIPFTTQSTQLSAPFSYSSGGNKTARVDGLSDSTSYYFRPVYYNSYVSNSSDWIDWEPDDGEYPLASTDSFGDFPEPSIIQNSISVNSSATEIFLQFNQNDPQPNDFSFRAADQMGDPAGGSYTLISSSGWGSSSNPKSGTWGLTGTEDIPYEIELRADGNVQYGSSNWTKAWYTPPPEDVTIEQPDSESGQLRVEWNRPANWSSGENNVDDVLIEWFVDGSSNGTTTVGSDSTSALSPFPYSNNQDGYARVRYRAFVNSEWVTSNTVTVNIVEPSEADEPTNLNMGTSLITWNHSTVRDSYRVQYDNGSGWQLLDTTTDNEIGFNFCGLAGGDGIQSLFIRVRAELNDGDPSDWVTTSDARDCGGGGGPGELQ